MSDPKAITFLPTLRPLRTNGDFHALHEAAGADAHRVIAPTHLVEKNGGVVGYCSLGGATPMLVWLDSNNGAPTYRITMTGYSL